MLNKSEGDNIEYTSVYYFVYYVGYHRLDILRWGITYIFLSLGKDF